MLTIPPEIVPTVHGGARDELGFAAEAILALCNAHGEKSDCAFEAAHAHLAAAYGLLAEIGYVTPEPSVAVEINLVKHLWILLRVMGGQRRAAIELGPEMDHAERNAADRRVQALDTLINAVACGC